MEADGACPTMRDDLLNALYASVSEVPAWTSFVLAARKLLAGDQAAVAISSADTAAPIVTCVNDAYLSAVEQLVADLPTLADGQPVVRALSDGCGLMLPVMEGTSCACIVLWRAGSDARFEPWLVALLASLADPLRRSLRIYNHFVDLVRRASMNEVALDTSGIGVALVDITGALIATNGVADSMLSDGTGLQLHAGRLHAESRGDTAALLAEIRRCALSQAAERDPMDYAPLPIMRSDHELPLTVLVRPGPAFSPLPRPLRRTAILVIRDPGKQPAWPAPALARLFGLSTAEALLASELARGASLEEAAVALGISRNTVRSQLQGIFLKTGVNRQSELIRALLNSAATSA